MNMTWKYILKRPSFHVSLRYSDLASGISSMSISHLCMKVWRYGMYNRDRRLRSAPSRFLIGFCGDAPPKKGMDHGGGNAAVRLEPREW